MLLFRHSSLPVRLSCSYGVAHLSFSYVQCHLCERVVALFAISFRSLGTLPRELSRDDASRPSFPIQSGHAADPGRLRPESSAATPQSAHAADRGLSGPWLGNSARGPLVLS